MKSKSVVKRYMILSMISGIAMGSVFPFFTLIFVKFSSLKIFILFFLSCVSAGICVGLISFTIGKTTVISAVKKLQISFIKVGEGDLNVECQIKSNDEIGNAADGFNELVKTLRETVQGIDKSTERIDISMVSVNKELESIMGNKDDSNGNSNKLTVKFMQRSLDNISELAKQQEISLNNSIAYINSVKRSGENIRIKSDAALMSTEELKSGIEDESKNIALSREIFDTIYRNSNNIYTTVGQMEKNSKHIVDILANTTSLLKQTNTLALNAKIESSRESVQGRGFAVVAEEMIKLAASTNELVDNMHGITDDILGAIKHLGNMSRLNTESVNSFKIINDKSHKNMNLILQELMGTAYEVNAMDGDIKNQISNMNHMKDSWHNIEKNSTDIYTQSDINKETIEVIKNQLKYIQDATYEFRMITGNLKEKVEFFTIER